MNALCRRLALMSIPLLLVACGGGSVGGTVSGLPDGDSVTLQNNGEDDLTVTKNGAFEFDTAVRESAGYSVTVSEQPATATCTVASGTGVMGVDVIEMNDVVVTCAKSSSVIGTISGLAAGAFVTLTNTSGGVATQLKVFDNGAFGFPGIKDDGTAYSVTITGQPLVGGCSIASGSGSVSASAPVPVQVICTF